MGPARAAPHRRGRSHRPPQRRQVDPGRGTLGSPAEGDGLVAFARSGNPNHKGLPSWDPFTAERRATMIFNNECRAVNDPYRDERLAVAAAQPARQSQER